MVNYIFCVLKDTISLLIWRINGMIDRYMTYYLLMCRKGRDYRHGEAGCGTMGLQKGSMAHPMGSQKVGR